ncbi:MAG: hypothetical protein IPL49_21895 [Saprospirales bacterium]|nr:hypothetical protein [Saprospirales bacterium]
METRSKLPPLMDQVESPVDRLGGDGAYDTYEIWDLLKERKIQGIIPPQSLFGGIGS